MSSSSIPDYYHVHIGTWTNFSHGQVFGATLTLNRRDGALLIAFIALFVTLVGTSFWRLACYALHHFYSTEVARDGLHHQVQATLRNSANGASGICNFFWILTCWRNDAKRPYRRTLPLIALTLCIVVAFGLASGYSSSISSALGNEVLIRSNRCGVLAPTDNTTTTDLYTVMFPYWTERTTAYSSYASQCYSNLSHSESCHFYVKDRLPMQSTRNASCPFGGDICRSPNNTLVLDSGLLDVHDDLGINLPADQRFLYRNMVRCAPLKVEPYQRFHNYTDATGVTTVARYFYGEQESGINYTYEYLSNPRELNEGITPNADYTLSNHFAFLGNGSFEGTGSGFYPIPELAYPDADIGLYFLSANDILFAKDVSDDWYSAHEPDDTTRENLRLNKPNVYYPRKQDTPVSTLACATQHQWCTSRSTCTPFTSYIDADAAVAPLLKTPQQAERYKWIFFVTAQSTPDISQVVLTQRAQALTSRARLFGGIQGPLPGNQWQLDVEHWYSTVLASLQGLYVDVAAGPADQSIARYLVRPENEQGRYLCLNQKIRSTAYTNISILGLVLILSVGTVIILLSLFLDPLISMVLRYRRLDTYAHLEWSANETITLQRLAHEELGLGRWKRCDGPVPVTEKGDLLGVLDLGENGHVRLKAPVRGWEEGGTGDAGNRNVEGDKGQVHSEVEERLSSVGPSSETDMRRDVRSVSEDAER